jgi:hypothetical protein
MTWHGSKKIGHEKQKPKHTENVKTIANHELAVSQFIFAASSSS